MTVGIKVDFLWFPIGTGDFFHSFFSTICINLENSDWGSKFPVIMNSLYAGDLLPETATTAIEELHKIKVELSRISPDKVVWDVEDLEKTPPWGNNISNEITNLAQYFVTTEGRNLIDVLEEAMNEGINENVALEVREL